MRLLSGLLAVTALAQAPAWYQTDFPPEEFQARWAKVYDKIGNQAIAVLQGVPLTAGFIMPRQSNEFYYLCGIETPHAYLLLDGRSHKATLYLPPQNRRLEAAEGKVLSSNDVDEVKRLTGVDEVLSTEVMRDNWLGKLPGERLLKVYSPLTPAEGNAQPRFELNQTNAAIASDPWDGRIPRELNFEALIRAQPPDHRGRPHADSRRNAQREESARDRDHQTRL